MIIKQLSVFVENRAGRLAEITKLLAGEKINIKALSIADTTSFGVLRMITDDTERAAELLKANKMTVSVNHVVAAAMDDRPGALSEILEILAQNGIQVEYMYAFMSKQEGKAGLVLRLEDNDTAEKLLSENGCGMTAVI